MPFDKNKAAAWIKLHALPGFGNHICAIHVRKALEAGGLNTTGHPAQAKDWGPTLTRLGFRAIANTSYKPQTGDVVVIQGTTASFSGHIELYDGQQWVSDFKQKEMWPGPSFRKETPAYHIYRYGS